MGPFIIVECVVSSLGTLSYWNSLYLALVGPGQPSCDFPSYVTPLPSISFHAIPIFYSLFIFNAVPISWIQVHYFSVILPVHTSVSVISFSLREPNLGHGTCYICVLTLSYILRPLSSCYYSNTAHFWSFWDYNLPFTFHGMLRVSTRPHQIKCKNLTIY